jgi:hypothetical protein
MIGDVPQFQYHAQRQRYGLRVSSVGRLLRSDRRQQPQGGRPDDQNAGWSIWIRFGLYEVGASTLVARVITSVFFSFFFLQHYGMNLIALIFT